jgi:hypothetical protein
MDEELHERINDYLKASGGRLIEQIGFGIHGTVFLVENNLNPVPIGVKFGVFVLDIHSSNIAFRKTTPPEGGTDDRL